MWVVSGPFDAESGGDVSAQKSKLLKTGKSYSLGRKNQPLIVPNKKISQYHCKFTVEGCTLENVHDPESRPTLTFYNDRDKGMRLSRGDSLENVGPKQTLELLDGDIIFIVTGLPISIKWLSVCCYSPNLRGKSSLSLETCNELGVSIVYTPNSYVTHHILPTYVANASVAASLISAAQFVKLEWLLEILKNEGSLEDNFVLPSISKFRPTFSPTLNPSQKVFKVWEPNEERFNIFSGYRFLVFGEKTREIESDLRELIKRGGGFIETFDVAGGVAKLHKALARGQAKEKRQLVVVADVKDMKAAIGSEEWAKIATVVQSFGLSITYPETLVQSVVDVQPSLPTAHQPSPVGTNALDSNVSAVSLPSCVPNSIPDEPSIPQELPTKKRLLRRAGSRQPSVEPEPPVNPEEENKNETPKPRRLLLSRRGRTAEPSDEAESSSKPPAPTPGRLRLKRRLGASGSAVPDGVAQSQLPDTLPSVAEEEPPLKKFKALFEASDPDRVGAPSFDEDGIGTGSLASQTQSHADGFGRKPITASTLSALREEEEESLASSEFTQRGTKRARGVDHEGDQDVEMADVDRTGGDGQPARKRQTLESTQNVERSAAITGLTTQSPTAQKTGKGRNPGAPVGQPDTDAEFLKAVASTKKGKRAEDVFDREFNNLRISKPKAVGSETQQREEEEEEWRRFTDFGDDTGLRGNFMVVLEMDVYRKRGNQWRDKPNFKKFKKKTVSTQRPLIELVASEDADFDTAPGHWRSKKNHNQRTSSFTQEIKMDTRPPPSRTLRKASIDIDDDSDNDQPPKFGTRNPILTQAKPTSRAGSRAPPARAASKLTSRANSVVPTTRGASGSSKPVLFLDSDDDIQEVDEQPSQNTTTARGDEDEEDQTLRSSGVNKGSLETMPRATTTRTRGRRTTAAGDDSDDDGAVFKGFGRRKR
ncbi:hypothetical protein AN958_05566 [Leucoagaricus sp. SymC.cos]|nr:hypothetical protein AN958_05566 [Leucoagaricus sp. SymC.cos]